MLAEKQVEAIPIDEPHSHPGNALFNPRVMDGHDIGVIQLGDGSGFLDKTSDGFRAIFNRRVQSHRLHGDGSAEHFISSAVYPAERTDPQQDLDVIALCDRAPRLKYLPQTDS